MYIKFTVPIEYKLFGNKQIEKKEFVAYFDPIDDEPINLQIKEGIIIFSQYISDPNLREFIDTSLVKKKRSDLLNKDYQLIISFFEDEDNNKGGYLLEYITPSLCRTYQEIIFDIEIEIDKNNAFFMPDNNVSIPYNNNNSIPNSNITGGFMNFNNKKKTKASGDKEESGNQFKNSNGKLENENNINDISNNFVHWNNMNKSNIEEMKKIWGNLYKNKIKIVGNGINNYAKEHKEILDEVQDMITNSLSKNDKSFIQKVIPGIMQILTNIKDSSSESLNNIFEKITKGYSMSELEKIISFLEKLLSTFGYNLPQRHSIPPSTNKNKTGGSNESIYTQAIYTMSLFNILLVFLMFLYNKIDEAAAAKKKKAAAAKKKKADEHDKYLKFVIKQRKKANSYKRGVPKKNNKNGSKKKY